MMNKIRKYVGITGLAAITALSSMGFGTINVLADDIKLPNYVMDGTNAERAVSDYFVNHFETVNENSVVIPHMDIIKTEDRGSALDVYGAYEVVEYTKDGAALKEDGGAFASTGKFTLKKNQDGTYTVESYAEIPDDANKADFENIFGRKLADEAFAIYCSDGGSKLWTDIYAQDVGCYAYDNGLNITKIIERNDQTIDTAGVSFSKDGTRKMYVQVDANVRSAGTKAASVIDGKGRGEDVTVTGAAGGWARIKEDERTGYIALSLLGDSKPAKEVKKEEKPADNVKGYVEGTIEAYNGDIIRVNGIQATISDDTELGGGEIRVGRTAKLSWRRVGDGRIYATSIYTVRETESESVEVELFDDADRKPADEGVEVELHDDAQPAQPEEKQEAAEETAPAQNDEEEEVFVEVDLNE